MLALNVCWFETQFTCLLLKNIIKIIQTLIITSLDLWSLNSAFNLNHEHDQHTRVHSCDFTCLESLTLWLYIVDSSIGGIASFTLTSWQVSCYHLKRLLLCYIADLWFSQWHSLGQVTTQENGHFYAIKYTLTLENYLQIEFFVVSLHNCSILCNYFIWCLAYR